MRIVLTDFISLDGVVQAPGGPEEDTDGGFRNGGWSMPFFDDETMGSAIDETLSGCDALLYGRRTWQTMAGHWPSQTDDPFADRLNAIEKYVASRTLTADDVASTWNNSKLLEGDAVQAVRDLKAREGGGIQMWGSSVFASQLIENDLVDEYLLMIEPVLLGGGKSIYPRNGQARKLDLVSVKEAKTGVLVCTYRPSR